MTVASKSATVEIEKKNSKPISLTRTNKETSMLVTNGIVSQQ